MGTPVKILDGSGNPVYVDTADTNTGTQASPVTNKVAVSNFPANPALETGNLANINTATGGQSDAAYTNGNGSIISILKGLFGYLGTLAGSVSSGKIQANLAVGGSTVTGTNPVPMLDGYQNPVSAVWTSATSLNTALTATTSGYDTVVVSHVSSGSITGGVVAFEVYDGTAWVAIKGGNIANYSTNVSYPLAGGSAGFQIPVAGFPQFRARLSTAISGSGSVTISLINSSAPDVSLVTVGLDPSQPLPQGTNGIGTVTIDSTNSGYLSTLAGAVSSSKVQIYQPGTTPTAGTVSASATAAALSSQACSAISIQNDPGSANNLQIGTASGTQPYKLTPGSSITITCTNANQIYVSTATGTATVNWITVA